MQTAAPTLTTTDHMILSHPHRDHVELLPDLLATYSVRQVWDSGRINDICGYRAFLTAVRDEPGVQYHNALQDFGTRDYAFGAKTNGCYGQAAPAVTLTSLMPAASPVRIRFRSARMPRCEFFMRMGRTIPIRTRTR